MRCDESFTSSPSSFELPFGGFFAELRDITEALLFEYAIRCRVEGVASPSPEPFDDTEQRSLIRCEDLIFIGHLRPTE